jgi:putative colanic acid biosynthesis UDP-glucose lipid carrier transferase
VLIAIGVKLSSPGPVLYRQERVTWNGHRFEMLKFRSMPLNAESASGPVWSRDGEARATGFGAFLRRYSLDELPQLCNVLKGEMSLVGPRPERPEFVRQYRQQIPGYMQKHLVKAGITGWARRSTTCAATATLGNGYNTISTTSTTGPCFSTCESSRSRFGTS